MGWERSDEDKFTANSRGRELGHKGVKKGQKRVKMEFFGNLSKSLHLFFFYLFYMLIEINNVILVKITSLAKFWFS